MKRFFLVLICIGGVMYMGTTPSFAAKDSGVYTPSPGYPADALKAKVVGAGKCVVEFGPSGHVDHANMTPSTGSKMLDENTLNFARKNWTGHPNTKLVVPVNYQLAPPAKAPAHVRVPLPPYPYQARAGSLQGRGTAKVSFDETGKAISITMIKSTGSSILDENTIAFGLSNWRSSGGKKMTIFVPVAYLLR